MCPVCSITRSSSALTLYPCAFTAFPPPPEQRSTLSDSRAATPCATRAGHAGIVRPLSGHRYISIAQHPPCRAAICKALSGDANFGKKRKTDGPSCTHVKDHRAANLNGRHLATFTKAGPDVAAYSGCQCVGMSARITGVWFHVVRRCFFHISTFFHSRHAANVTKSSACSRRDARGVGSPISLHCWAHSSLFYRSQLGSLNPFTSSNSNSPASSEVCRNFYGLVLTISKVPHIPSCAEIMRSVIQTILQISPVLQGILVSEEGCSEYFSPAITPVGLRASSKLLVTFIAAPAHRGTSHARAGETCCLLASVAGNALGAGAPGVFAYLDNNPSMASTRTVRRSKGARSRSFLPPFPAFSERLVVEPWCRELLCSRGLPSEMSAKFGIAATNLSPTFQIQLHHSIAKGSKKYDTLSEECESPHVDKEKLRRTFKFRSTVLAKINRFAASQKQSSDTHKTPYDRVKLRRERIINIKASERVNFRKVYTVIWSRNSPTNRKRQQPLHDVISVAADEKHGHCDARPTKLQLRQPDKSRLTPSALLPACLRCARVDPFPAENSTSCVHGCTSPTAAVPTYTGTPQCCHRRMDKVMRPMAKAEEYSTRMQVDHRQGYQKCSFDHEQHIYSQHRMLLLLVHNESIVSCGIPSVICAPLARLRLQQASRHFCTSVLLGCLYALHMGSVGITAYYREITHIPGDTGLSCCRQVSALACTCRGCSVWSCVSTDDVVFNLRPGPGFSKMEIVTGGCCWLAGFLGIFRLPCPLFPFSPHFTLIGSQDLVAKSRQNLWTQRPSWVRGFLRPSPPLIPLPANRHNTVSKSCRGVGFTNGEEKRGARCKPLCRWMSGRTCANREGLANVRRKEVFPLADVFSGIGRNVCLGEWKVGMGRCLGACSLHGFLPLSHLILVANSEFLGRRSWGLLDGVKSPVCCEVMSGTRNKVEWKEVAALVSPDRRMSKVMRPMTTLILHKAGEHTTCIQVELKQGFQKRSFDHEWPIPTRHEIRLRVVELGCGWQRCWVVAFLSCQNHRVQVSLRGLPGIGFPYFVLAKEPLAATEVYEVCHDTPAPCREHGGLAPLQEKRDSYALFAKAESKYRNGMRLEGASQKQSSDSHKTPHDRVKRCREPGSTCERNGRDTWGSASRRVVNNELPGQRGNGTRDIWVSTCGKPCCPPSAIRGRAACLVQSCVGASRECLRFFRWLREESGNGSGAWLVIECREKYVLTLIGEYAQLFCVLADLDVHKGRIRTAATPAPIYGPKSLPERGRGGQEVCFCVMRVRVLAHARAPPRGRWLVYRAHGAAVLRSTTVTCYTPTSHVKALYKPPAQLRASSARSCGFVARSHRSMYTTLSPRGQQAERVCSAAKCLAGRRDMWYCDGKYQLFFSPRCVILVPSPCFG
ncbi:hypothetical protein PR048_025926 [Dryococelus australis]|uniref:Uncharacterized protein n=1 Tax=Dryococelus australis TaxID=614101 RepID=A0ABQ9GJY9_9NEOP|nr:hypothetical protein PR048_025926 [Dryococelus australis]